MYPPRPSVTQSSMPPHIAIILGFVGIQYRSRHAGSRLVRCTREVAAKGDFAIDAEKGKRGALTLITISERNDVVPIP